MVVVPAKGQKALKMASFELASTDLQPLRETIARSPIFQAALAARLADWERTRMSSDVDAVILAWIGSHVRRRPRAALM